MMRGSRQGWEWLHGLGVAMALAAIVAVDGCSRKSTRSSGGSNAPAAGSTEKRGGGGEDLADDLLPVDQAELQRLKSFMTGGLPARQQYPTVKAISENLKLAPEVRDQAKDYLKELEATIRKRGEEALAPVAERATEAMKEGRLAQALAIYDQFVQNYPAAERALVEDLVVERREEVKEKIDERFASDKLKIEGAVAESRFDDALALVREIGSYGDQEKVDWASKEDARILDIQKRKREEEERRIAESQRKMIEDELKKEEERRKAAEKKESAPEEEPVVAEGPGEEGAPEEASAPAGEAGPEEASAPAGEAKPAAPAGEPFAMVVTLSSLDKKTGIFEIKPLQTPSGPRKIYNLEIPDGAQCHIDTFVPPAQFKILEKNCEVWLYGTTIERSRPSPTGSTYDRMIQNPEAVAFGPALNPDQEYKNPRMGAEAKWHQGRLGEWERGPLPILIEGRSYELRGQPRNQCFFQRAPLDLTQFRENASSFTRRVAVVLGEASEVPKDPDAKGSSSKTQEFNVRARACLFIEPRLARLPVYRALYEKYDPRVTATVKAPAAKDDKGEPKPGGKKR
ncbi:MAG: hypothetical protein JXP34_17945 [Planctomycetes bacterium]|nr:hypothetical protein [Planctomycetota bacterium]